MHSFFFRVCTCARSFTSSPSSHQSWQSVLGRLSRRGSPLISPWLGFGSNDTLYQSFTLAPCPAAWLMPSVTARALHAGRWNPTWGCPCSGILGEEKQVGARATWRISGRYHFSLRLTTFLCVHKCKTRALWMSRLEWSVNLAWTPVNRRKAGSTYNKWSRCGHPSPYCRYA